MWKGLLLIFGGIAVNYGSITNHEPCRQDDNVCLTEIATLMYTQTVTKGDPSLNIQPSDPMYQEEIVGNLATIKYKLMKTTIVGFGRCAVVNTTLSLEKNKLSLELVCPYISMVGDYDIDGKVLGTYIQGNGDYNYDTRDYIIVIDTDIKITQGSYGKKYISIKSFKVTADCRGGMHFDLRNLFSGQKELGESVLKFMNKNWKLVAKVIQGPTLNTNIKKMVKNFNKYLNQRPLDTLIVLE